MDKPRSETDQGAFGSAFLAFSRSRVSVKEHTMALFL